MKHITRPECKTCNSQSAKLGCLWPVLHGDERCKLETKGGPIGDVNSISPFQPDDEDAA